jgi:uncharacterized protein YyaL (SSP411 family)
MFRFSPRTNQAHRVAWHAWGEAAFEQARQQDKPLVLFLTAFWCGYCQRMDETALSNDEVIALLNAFFIPVRVEESQRPDVDLRYNQDGWPTIAFLTPDGDHLFSVNYTAPEPFIRLLVRVVDSFQRDKASLLEAAAQNRAKAKALSAETPAAAPLDASIVAEIAGMLEGLADTTHGGYGTQFKFLHHEANDFFIYLFESTGETSYLDHVILTLDKMRHSRTFDAVDGGFFRYSSKPNWQEPHAEKLLDDQAALLRNYLRAYLLTGQSTYRETAEGLIDYLNTTLSAPQQPFFFGCQDYVRPAMDLAASRTGPPPMLSLIDEYVYCDANARVASAYLDAWWLLGRDDCKERAQQILAYLWNNLRVPHGGMYHYADTTPHVPGLLMDSAMLASALLDAYALIGDTLYLQQAEQLAGDIVRLHRNPAGGFSDLSQTGPGNLQFPVTVLTQNATLAALFVRLADLSGDLTHRKTAYWALKHFPNAHRRYEAFAAGFGHALGRLLAIPLIMTITGMPGDTTVRGIARAALTQLRHGDLLIRFQADHAASVACIDIQYSGQHIGPITDPAALRPAMRMLFDQRG